MKKITGWAISAAAFAAAGLAQDASPNQTQRTTVPFRDPAAAHKLEVNLTSGRATVTVKGTERSDVLVEYTGRAGSRGFSQPPPGMHRIGGSGNLDVIEDNNVVRVSNGLYGGSGGDLNIQVPVQTAVIIALNGGGKIEVDNIGGEMEVNNENGEIDVTNASGPVVAHSSNGKIIASFNKVAAGKAMSLSTFNGNIDVTLPADAKATLKARADNGEVDTDFDVKIEPQQAAVNGAQPAQAAQPAPPLPPAPPGSQYNAEQIRQMVRQAMESARQAARQAGKYAEARRGALGDGTVVGTINGGGTEIQFTTFNGRILIHKK